MNQKNKKLLKRIQYTAYIQFFLSILFWIGVGINIFPHMSYHIYIFMLLLLVCNIFILLSSYLLDRFYLVYLHDSFDNLEKLNMKLRTQRHEYLNEMQIVYGLLELGESEEALAYLKPVYQDIAKVGKALKTAKPAVNALLQSKMEYASNNNVEFFVEVSSNLENCAIEQWDLCKILGNLIDNAITAVKEDTDNTKQKQVHVLIREDAASYFFSVYNNGPVIPENKQELIFKKGYTSKKESGHGLGLGIIKDIVLECNGKIRLQSREGKTEFEAELPKVR